MVIVLFLAAMVAAEPNWNWGWGWDWGYDSHGNYNYDYTYDYRPSSYYGRKKREAEPNAKPDYRQKREAGIFLYFSNFSLGLHRNHTKNHFCIQKGYIYYLSSFS